MNFDIIFVRGILFIFKDIFCIWMKTHTLIKEIRLHRECKFDSINHIMIKDLILIFELLQFFIELLLLVGCGTGKV